MILQDALRSGVTPEDLRARFGIKSNRHSRFASLVQFTYSQIDSPMHEPIVQESRGVILNETDGWSVIARPFDKFFNLGEPHAPAIDWNTASVLEKVDGTLCILYRYRGEWQVATKGMPDARGNVNGSPLSFADLFWSTFREMGLPLPEEIWPGADGICWMFELTGPLNRVVVQHSRPSLTLIGAREKTGREIHPAHLPREAYPVVRAFSLRTLDDVRATLDAMRPTEQEGYVVVDAAFRRVKIKNPAYLALHHLKDGLSAKRLVEIVQANEGAEFLAVFPEWEAVYREIAARFDALVAELDHAYACMKDAPDQKAFAALATKTKWPGALFLLRKGAVATIREAMAGVHVDRMTDLLGAAALVPGVASEAA